MVEGYAMQNAELLKIKQEVDSAFDKVFSGNNRINEGHTDNHCNKETLEYFAGLYEGRESSLQRKEKILKKLGELDIENLQENVIKIVK